MTVRIEYEMYPGDCMEVDPHDLYDDQLISLAEHLERKTLDPEQLDDTCWYLWDLTLPAKPIRVIRSG